MQPTAGSPKPTTTPIQAHAAPASPIISPVRVDFDLPNIDFVEGSSSIPMSTPELLQELQLAGSAASPDDGKLSLIQIHLLYSNWDSCSHIWA